LEERQHLVVLRVEVVGVIVRIGLLDPDMKIMLQYLRDLVERAGRDPLDRVSRLQLHPAPSDERDAAQTQALPQLLEPRPLLDAALTWIQAVLRRAGLKLPGEEQTPAAADEALNDALRGADARSEPLAALARRLDLSALEFRLVLLALAPELDTLYQRCIVELIGEVGRRVGTLGLYAALLGDPVAVRRELALSGNLARWRLFENRTGHGLPAADESLRLDPCVLEWLLGDRDALEQDARLRNVLRRAPWPGASLIEDVDEIRQVANQLQLLQQAVHSTRNGARWLLFNGDQTPTWYALLERAGDLLDSPPLRVQAARIAALDTTENGETARRLTRVARLSHRPLLLDAARIDATPENDAALRALLTEIAAGKCRAGIICTNVSRFIGLLGIQAIRIVPDSCVPQNARQRSLRVATNRLGIQLNSDLLQTLEQQFPLQPDGWERALQLTRARRMSTDTPAQLTPRFVAACRDVAAEAVSNLAMRLDPHCMIDHVVLPSERKDQLRQIVNGVNFARHVLEDWKFGEQLAYGRGVTAMFHGASGTGKTMSALAIAGELNSQVLRIDLSRVVSKYIGETEKHIDAVFRDATQCGAVLLIDEADALLGKRGEIKDAHDRYSVMEVSFLLQRIESYDGVAIFTTNARQNIDPAFLRRLRFIIEFPRPDAAAREEIWRRCLPEDSHQLSDADFRQLARKIDMTGGHIRQITLQAAFLAAAEKTRIALSHIAQASR
ncbi:MAG: ATP-binding protein, partial [Steroidobacteraceae bacterium]